MEVKEKGEFKVVGFDMETSVQECSKELPALWEKIMKRKDEVKNIVGDKAIGLCISHEPVSECKFRYLAGFEVSDFEDVPEGMVKETVPASKYAAYVHKGKISEVGKTYGFAMEDIPKQGLKEGLIWFEVYPMDYNPSSDDSEMEIWCGVEEIK